jgi:hypothetical protein
VSGDKGGVGKTMTSIGIADYMIRANINCRMIETDTGNPDAALIMNDEIKCEALDTTKEAPWHELLRACEENKDENIVINAGARDNVALKAWGKDYLEAIAQATSKTLVTLWVVAASEEKDGLTALREYLSMLKNRTYAVECEAKGKLQMYDGSKTRGEVEATGGSLLSFPALSSICALKMKTSRMSPSKLVESGNILEKIATGKWRSRIDEFMENVK